jgi:hypothetical protein
MKLTVFGATVGIRREVVTQAIATGDHVPLHPQPGPDPELA